MEKVTDDKHHFHDGEEAYWKTRDEEEERKNKIN